jgi:predicted metal-binding membrane protein
MPGQTWSAAAVSFLAMWLAMMAVMMLPSLVPTLWRYREAVSHSGAKHPGRLTWVVALAYFFVLTIVGAAVFPFGVASADLLRRDAALARAVPITVGVVFLGAGALQFTAWKTHHLLCCRTALDGCHSAPAHLSTAWRYGVRLGMHCMSCCAGLTASLLVIGIMDLRAMAVATAAITAERLAPRGERMARVIGVIVVVAGSMLVARAARL